MKILKTVLYIILIIIAIGLIASGVMPKKMNVQSEVIIAKPQQEVFDFVKMLDNQKYYSKWVMADPNVKITMTGVDGEVGAISSWESDYEDVGIGAQEIISIDPGKKIEYELRFKKPFEATDTAYTIIEAIDSTHTKVINGFRSKMPFPMNIMLPMVKKMLQEDMDGNMKRLDSVIASR